MYVYMYMYMYMYVYMYMYMYMYNVCVHRYKSVGKQGVCRRFDAMRERLA